MKFQETVSGDYFHLDEGSSDNSVFSEQRGTASDLFDENRNLNSVLIICSGYQRYVIFP